MRRILFCILFTCLMLPALAAAQDVPTPVQKALDDLNARLGLSLKPEDVTWRFNQKVFDDASLGCPQPGQTYYQGKTIGYTVQFDVQNVTWDYRISPDLHLTLCNSLAATMSTPSPNASPLPTLSSGREYPTNPPPPMIQSVICKGAPPSRLRHDTLARLVRNVTITVRIYKIANWEEAVNEVQPGDVLKVLEGPMCAGGKAWWQVVDMRNFARGWIAENEGAMYLFEPADPSSVNSNGSTGNNAFPTPSVNQNCPGALPSRLLPAAPARVLPAVNTHIYATFNDLSSARYDITTGRTVQIINGPYCAPNAAWWGMLDYQTGFQGWIVEGQDTYFFEPIASTYTDSGFGPTPTPVWNNPGGGPTAAPKAPTYYPTPPPPPQDGVMAPTLTPSSNANCVPHLRSRLLAGSTVRALVNVNMMGTPRADGYPMIEIPTGTTFTIVGGPSCTNNTLFWITIYGGLRGWIQEANGESYLVEPV